MKKLGLSLLALSCTLWLAAGIALAQSSGNFSAQIDNDACVLNSSSGALSPTCPATGLPTNGTECVGLSAPIKVSNANGLTLLVTPSMVTGLFTDTKIDTTVSSSSADIGVQVCVTVTADGSTTPVANAVLGGDSNGCVVYDQRFQEISSGLFSTLSACQAETTTISCTPGSTTSGDSYCQSVTGNTGAICDSATDTCEIPASAVTGCNFELILSTLSAHAYNFIVTVPGGTYDVNAAWSLIGVDTSGKASVAACAGPGTLTVTQTKVFNNSGSVTTLP